MREDEKQKEGGRKRRVPTILHCIVSTDARIVRTCSTSVTSG